MLSWLCSCVGSSQVGLAAAAASRTQASSRCVDVGRWLLDVLEDQVERREALLAVDQLPPLSSASASRRPAGGSTCPRSRRCRRGARSTSSLAPAVAALVARHEEVPADVADLSIGRARHRFGHFSGRRSHRAERTRRNTRPSRGRRRLSSIVHGLGLPLNGAARSSAAALLVLVHRRRLGLAIRPLLARRR